MFEWDDEKTRSNTKKHKISFEEAVQIFSGTVLTKVDDREDYGEVREISTGMLGNTAIVIVVHTDRNGQIRLISARPAKRPERQEYYEYCKKIT